MNVYEYCDSKNLDISKLSDKSMDAIGGMFLENVNPTQDEINRLADIDSGLVTPEQALQRTFELARKLSSSAA